MRLILPALLLTVSGFVGCSHEQTAGTSSKTEAAVVTADNELCPVMGNKVTADGGRVEWNGKTIGFCCPDCIEEFEAMSDNEKEAALAKAAEEHDGHVNDGHDHDEHDGDASEQS